MRWNWGYLRDAGAFVISVAAAFIYDLDAKQVGIAAWVGTLLGGIAIIYLAILIGDAPGKPPRTMLSRIVDALIGGTLVSAIVIWPNLWLASFAQVVHPDHAELREMPFWKSFPTVIYRALAEHGILVVTLALEQILRVRQAVAQSGDRTLYLTHSLGELGRFLILAFVLLIFHVISAPAFAVVFTLAVLCIPYEVFRPKD